MSNPALTGDDPLDIRRILVDIVELLCHKILTDHDHRERANQLEYFLQRIGGDNMTKHSRLYSRIKLAAVSQLLREEMFSSGDSIKKSTFVRITTRTPLYGPTLEKWGETLDKFKELRDCLVDNNANAVVIPRDINELVFNDDRSTENSDPSRLPEVAVINESAASHKLFGDDYERVLGYFRFQQALSHLQPYLHAVYESANEESLTKTCSETRGIADFQLFVSVHFKKDDEHRKILESMFASPDCKRSERETRSRGLSLKPYTDLKKIINKDIFDLKWIQERANDLLLKWNEHILTKPKLLELEYGRSPLPTLQNCHMENDEKKANESFANGANDSHDGECNDYQEVEKEEVSICHRFQERHLTEHNDANGKKKASKNGDARLPEVEELAQARRKSKENEVGKEKVSICQSVHDQHSMEDNDANDKNEKTSKKGDARLPEVEELVQARRKLRENGTDPLEESRDLAEKYDPIKRRKVASFLHEKKSVTRIHFSDSESDSDTEDRVLSEVPARADINREQLAQISSTVVQHSIIHQRKKRKFTDEEKDAIKIGVERFGYGRWAIIKGEHKEALRNRTSVNIKDCYRTMMRKNEV